MKYCSRFLFTNIKTFTLKNKNELIFTGTSKVSSKLPLTLVGDKVRISYDKTDSKIISISEFDNENIGKNTDSNKNKNDKENNKDKQEK